MQPAPPAKSPLTPVLTAILGPTQMARAAVWIVSLPVPPAPTLHPSVILVLTHSTIARLQAVFVSALYFLACNGPTDPNCLQCPLMQYHDGSECQGIVCPMSRLRFFLSAVHGS